MEVKNEKRIRRRDLWLARFFNNYLVMKNWMVLTFFVASFAFFAFVLRISELGRILITFYGFFVILLCFLLMAEYVYKTIHLQRIEVRNYSAFLSINTVFGLILPLIYFDVILAVVMRSMYFMTYYGTFLCKVRVSIVNFYYNTGSFQQVNNLIFWLVIMTAILFIFGGLVERTLRTR